MKQKTKLITMKEYNKKMDKILSTNLPVHEKLINALEYARTIKLPGRKK